MKLQAAIFGALSFSSRSIAAASPLPGPGGWDSLLQVGYALLFVLVLIIGGSWLMRRVGNFGGTAGKLMRVMGALSVGSRERVVLVEVGGKQLLLGVAPGRVSTLHVLEQALSTDTAAETPTGFREVLSSLGRKKNTGAGG